MADEPPTGPAAVRVRAGRRRLLLLAAPLVAATAVVVGVVIVLRDDVRHGGPLACGRCDYIVEGMPLDVHRSGTEGSVVLENRGDRDAVLDAVTYERLTSGLRILGPLALRVGDHKGRASVLTGLARGYPPPQAHAIARPLRGFVVHPYRRYEEAVELLNGFRPLRPGVFGYRALFVHYHVHGQRYVARYPFKLVICAPESKYNGRCEPQR